MARGTKATRSHGNSAQAKSSTVKAELPAPATDPPSLIYFTCNPSTTTAENEVHTPPRSNEDLPTLSPSYSSASPQTSNPPTPGTSEVNYTDIARHGSDLDNEAQIIQDLPSKIPTALLLSSEANSVPLVASVEASPSSTEVTLHRAQEQDIRLTPTALGPPAPDALQPAAIINDPPTSAVLTAPNSDENTTEGTAIETPPFDVIQDLLHVQQEDLNDHNPDVPVPEENPPAIVTEDTQFILQVLQDRGINLTDLPFVDSATPIMQQVGSALEPSDVPVTTICDAFPSHPQARRAILKLAAHPGTPQLRNLALANPHDLHHKNKFIREASDIATPSKFFTVGKIMACRLGDEGRGKQICLAPIASMFPRMAAVLATLFKVRQLGFYSFMTGVTFSTLLQTNRDSKNPNNNAELLRTPPKKKARVQVTNSAPYVLQFNDTVPVYDARGIHFDPQEYASLPRYRSSIPNGACAMVIFSVGSTRPLSDFLDKTEMDDYPVFASFNILAAVYIHTPDANQRAVEYTYLADAIGVSFDPSSTAVHN